MPRAKPGEKKRGNLSLKEMAYIKKNVDNKSAAEIAATLNRTVAPVKRYIEANRLGKKYLQALQVGDKTELILLNELKKKPFYRMLKHQMSDLELEYFQESWISILKQFGGDIFASEELELKEFIMLEIIKNRMLTEKKLALLDKESLKKELHQQTLLPYMQQDREQVRYIRSEINAVEAKINNYVKEFQSLATKTDMIRKALKASREQRLHKIDQAKVNFGTWIRQLTDPEIRGKIARELEIMRLAMEKSKYELGQYITYSNKEVDKPILNSETVGEKNE